ncbi:hypothetical protein EYF80_003882 [Liparis tanakae]|uniref:Uncharacterized protein n=1 Tax=Liparis tanakae TaxID=230148 RepID=A0A4Z2J8K7_9TELE|nr:hypothetical protein EYF80_003882 [Liparis tanakae]
MFSSLATYSPPHSHELRLRAGLLLHELVAPLQRGVSVLLLVGGGEGEEAQRLHGEGQVRGVSQGVARVQVDPHDGRAVVLAPQDVALETETAEVQPEEDEEEDDSRRRDSSRRPMAPVTPSALRLMALNNRSTGAIELTTEVELSLHFQRVRPSVSKSSYTWRQVARAEVVL